MISIVVVSHSRALATAAVALAGEMVGDEGPAVEVAAGLDETTTGTDAMAVAEAITRADDAAGGDGGDGVLVLVDLGSAVLSAEMALELVDPEVAERVRVSPAPLVEGLVAAVVQAATGADLARVAAEAEGGLRPKAAQLSAPVPGTGDGGTAEHPGAGLDAEPTGDPGAGDDGADREGGRWEQAVELSVTGEHGLHARPAARLVACASSAGPDTEVRVTNLTAGRGPADARSLSSVALLGAQQGHVLLAEARGPGAADVLARLTKLAGTAFGDAPAPAEPLLPSAPAVPPAASTEPGVAGTGLEAALGPVVRVEAELDASGVEPRGVQEEQELWRGAVATAVDRLQELAAYARTHLGEGEAEVFEAHAVLLGDPGIHAEVADRVQRGEGAARAWQTTVGEAAGRFEQLSDSYQRERAQDVRSVGDRVLRIILGREEPEALGEGVLVVDELDPAVAISLDAEVVSGVVTLRGGRTGHGLLILQARGVPVLSGAGPRADVPTGTLVGFDARTQRLEVDPDERTQAELERLIEDRRTLRAGALERTIEPAVTTDGRRIVVKANVSDLAVARMGAELGAEGSGLVRTEAVFARWRSAPRVEQQTRTYAAIAAAYRPHGVTFRTWDVGGDKPLEFVTVEPGTNPFLGERGVRAFVDDPALMLDQLEALCAVAQEHPVGVMFPMVTTRADVERSLRWLDEAAARMGLDAPPADLRTGIMVEVPAAALRVGELAAGLDFVSIGSNDLAQYTLAAERGNAGVDAWSDSLEPAVLQLIRHVADEVPGGVSVGLCGGLAADPDLAGLLVGLGVQELSSSASSVPMVKERLRGGSTQGFRALADRALACADADEVRELLARAAADAGQV